MALRTFWPMFKKECLEQLRTYRVLIAVIILLLLGVSAPITTKLLPDLLQNAGGRIKITMPPQTANDALDSYIKNMTQLPALMLILLAMGCIADERGRGTAVTVLTKPLPRSVFVLTKFFTFALTLLVSTALTAVVAYFYTYQLFSALPAGPFLLLNLALFIFFLLVLAVTVLASVFFRSAIAAGGLAFVGFLALSLLPGLNNTIAQALPSELFSSERLPQVLAGTASAGDVLWPLSIGVGLVILLLVITCFIFQRQEV
jgi:ABC-2 type transport system permease protein